MVKISKLKFKLNAGGKTDADAIESFKYFKNIK